MFKWLHPYAKSENLYRLSGKFLLWFGWLGFIGAVVGTIWGLGFTPADYQQGDSFRIIYVHVPMAMMSMGGYLGMAIAAFIGVVWQQKHSDMMVMAIAPIGAIYTFLALFTGAAWGKPMWGTWWIWDARLTSELILLFLYLGVMALYNAYSDKRSGARAAGILAMVGVINLPIIHYSVEWWNTLHQGATITKFAKPSMDTSMLWPLLINVLAFGLLLGALALMRLRNDLLRTEGHRPWVQKIVEGEN
ncbi:heme ABC transporter permease [Echinimonas agarilytica]|uniref:Heme exporter protein C n=1 Tax=Echinimonas agarilytica TaxID=1215918 RepID=A0AA42B6S1_9GAMM|nr:heme ABC transporter permease [Echinimonas agarilytica]MCM2679000.1 heme ABC transporter permease [Echinimonas agarilytica]